MRAMVAFVLLCLTSPAFAGELVVQVRTPNGAPVRNAVVSVYPGGKAVPAAALKTVYRIAQRELKFSPFVLIVPVGAKVAFPNYDNVRHHVYSFSRAKRFELKLYAREQDRTVHFGAAGVVPLGCNIHDGMTAFVKVADTALVVQTDATGRTLVAGAPAGPAIIRVWHPYLRAPANQIELHVLLPGAGRAAQAVTVNLRPPPAAAASY